MSNDMKIPEFKRLAAEDLNPMATGLLPLGLRIVRSEEDPEKVELTLEEHDDELEADLFALIHIAKHIQFEEGVLTSGEGAVGMSLLTYHEVSQTLLNFVSGDDDTRELGAIKRTALENYPMFYDAEQIAQQSALNVWDAFKKKEAE
ncbi:hypothetical protein [Pseudogemmobacter faecipullorum]|uniref:Tail assembly chaperone n=1 Tax=Pseudogemmobacter faecipullorum TaxID=2755041 RepID=A0ABS8CQR3_9RHOB|nr:hypothetical protein [Pseudogemmobacter faecipullorum]MCB5411744.1 hypothetical protein [Pseudogemmobacter faecipullorum]